MNTLQDQLSKWKKAKTVLKKQKEKRLDKPKSEQLSDREWKDLMGINKPTYKRHRGSFRQR